MDISKAQEIFERYKANFDALNAFIYSQSSTEDLIMLRWWMHLSETGDINRLMLPEARRLSSFLNTFKLPTTLIYSLDSENNICSAFWASQVDGVSKHRAAYCGVWTRADLRGRRFQFDFNLFAYTFTFEFYDALLGMTWQQDLLDLHQKLGYSIVGCIPNLHDEDFVYIVHLTREAFQSSRPSQIGRK